MKMHKEIVMVRLADIIPNRFQPRLTFDDEALSELASSIKEHGIIQPLILRDLGNKYEIIAGERRYKAAQLAGVLEVPAVIGQMDDQTSAELALIENIQRKDLSAIEEAKSYKKILDMGGLTQDELAKRMGKGQSTIANKMRLLNLTNEVQAALMNNLISERHARCLLQIKDESMQKSVLNKVISERMNVRDTDNYIKSTLGINHDVVKEDVITPTMEESSNPTPTNHEEQPKENPNVYSQTKNMDFIDIDRLTSPEAPKLADGGQSLESKEVPNDLMNEILNAEENSFNDNTPIINNAPITDIKLEEEEKNMPNQEPLVETTHNTDNISKIKMATAIRLAKDTLEDIKAAGYQASIEEKDSGDSYQIIINVQK